jgi:hypothetical protein
MRLLAAGCCRLAACDLPPSLHRDGNYMLHEVVVGPPHPLV